MHDKKWAGPLQRGSVGQLNCQYQTANFAVNFDIFAPPPHLPQKMGEKVDFRLRGFRTKNSLGDVFTGQNGDFTRGHTINSTPSGRVHEWAQKGGLGLPGFDLTTSAK